MKPISVMLVDDNPIFLKAATQFLEAHESVVVVGTADGGEEALKKAQELRPQVILIDLAMPRVPGLEVIPRLRGLLPEVVIVALTVMNANSFRQAALKAGADEFIPKSAMRTDLLPTIRRLARDSRGALAEPADAAAESTLLAPRRVLVMEDDISLCRLYSKALRAAGYEVHQAASIHEARDLLTDMRFDVFLCDIHMGSDRGTDLLRQYSITLSTSGTQVVMVSGQSHYRTMCKEMGVEYFLEKPVGVGTLVALVDRITARRSFTVANGP